MEPFRIHRQGPILVLELDTPDASVNVFGPPAAAQLRAVLSNPPPGVDTLLLRSGKPGSFVNGAGLLYANAMRSPQQALAISAPSREVYEALAQAELITVAAIEGNCFGCGLELALCCDFRLARDIAETQFRMTELTDYRFVPLFGGTWRLPRRIGVRAAERLLLDGERWDAKTALRAGLVDAVIAADEDGDAVLARVQAIREGRVRPRAPGGTGALRVSERHLPPTRAALWSQVRSLLVEGASATAEQSRQKEWSAFAETVTSRAAKNAMSYFFVRHAARAVSLGTAQRTIPELSLSLTGAVTGAHRQLLVRTSAIHPSRVLPLQVESHTRLAGPGLSLLLPYGPKVPFCEVGVTEEGLDEGRKVAAYLNWMGLEAVLTRPAPQHASTVLLAGTRRALWQWASAGIAPARINRALWDGGFARPFRFAGWPRQRARQGHARILPQLASVWRGLIADLLRTGVLTHQAQGDVLIHALFDFPLEAGTFSRWALGQKTDAAQRTVPAGEALTS